MYYRCKDQSFFFVVKLYLYKLYKFIKVFFFMYQMKNMSSKFICHIPGENPSVFSAIQKSLFHKVHK